VSKSIARVKRQFCISGWPFQGHLGIAGRLGASHWGKHVGHQKLLIEGQPGEKLALRLSVHAPNLLRTESGVAELRNCIDMELAMYKSSQVKEHKMESA
jgi:hypothetical protein